MLGHARVTRDVNIGNIVFSIYQVVDYYCMSNGILVSGQKYKEYLGFILVLISSLIIYILFVCSVFAKRIEGNPRT